MNKEIGNFSVLNFFFEFFVKNSQPLGMFVVRSGEESKKQTETTGKPVLHTVFKFIVSYNTHVR